MRLTKQPEHLLQKQIEFTIALDGGDSGSVSFTRLVPIGSDHRGIEMFLFHRPPDDLEGLLSNGAAVFDGRNGCGDALSLRRLCLRSSLRMRPRAAKEEGRSERKRRRQNRSFVHQSLLFKKRLWFWMTPPDIERAIIPYEDLAGGFRKE